MKKHLNIIISGKVQGVGFRYFAKSNADILGVKGFVQNRPDKSVYMEAEAEGTILSLFLDECRNGPDDAVITSFETSEGELKNYRNFEVVRKNR